jgi:hypothetical protein
MFATRQPRVRASKPGFCGTAAKVVALGMAVAMLSLYAQKTGKKPVPPNPPGNFHVTTTTDDSVSFAWNPVTGATYELFNDTAENTLNVGNVTSYTWTGLQAGDTYSFHVVAVVNKVASASSPEVTVKLPGAPPPPTPNTPGNFQVTATTDNSVSFAWNPVTGATYELFNDTTGLTFNVGNVTSYTWSPLTAGYTYSFHIVAVVNNVSSASSPEVTVTIPGAPAPPPAVQPAAPVITSTSATSDSITVSWTESTPVSELNEYAILVNGIGALV